MVAEQFITYANNNTEHSVTANSAAINRRALKII